MRLKNCWLIHCHFPTLLHVFPLRGLYLLLYSSLFATLSPLIPDPGGNRRIVHNQLLFAVPLAHTDHVGVLFAVPRFWLQGARDKTRERERVRGVGVQARELR